VHDTLLVVIVLLAVVACVGAVAPRLRVPYPILLAAAGLLAAVVPGVPTLPLDPDLILLIFLPPLLYSDAFQSSWLDFRRWLRPIAMLAIGLVAATTLLVGLVAKACFPDLPWAACFILGAVVSPTDTVAAQAVIERLRIPRRITAILGGESLVNDATGLVGVQLGVAVALSGVFHAGDAALSFAWVAGGGVVAGLAVGIVFAWVNTWRLESAVLFTCSLLAPYLAFAAAAAAGASGVLAVVVAGFLVSWRIHDIRPASRLALFATWEQLVFVLNGFCFIFIGLETPRLLRSLGAAGTWPVTGAALIALTVIVLRIAWCVPGAYVPLWISARMRGREGGYPALREVFVLSWCGMRGVVSLAAALALPPYLADGQPFPGRDLIIFCTLAVIFSTLVVQGLSLLPLIRLLGIRDDAADADEIRHAREAVLGAGIARLDAFCSEHSCPIAVHHLREAMVDELDGLHEQDSSIRDRAAKRRAVSIEVKRAIHAAQGQELLRLRDRQQINDRTCLMLQLELDRSEAG
jgi:CPA1 family monovalent cation:H+ antiporter